MNRSALIAVILIFAGGASLAGEPEKIPTPRSWSFVEAGKIPIQTGGRIKPLDSFARDTVLSITGSRSFGAWNPVDLLLSWVSFPEYWGTQPIIRISNKELLRQLVLDNSRSRFSLEELLKTRTLPQYAEGVMSDGGVEAKQVVKSVNSQPSPRDQELKRVIERIGVFRAVAAGSSFTLVSNENNGVQGAWAAISSGDPTQHPIRKSFLELIRAYYGSEEKSFYSAVSALKNKIVEGAPGWNSSVDRSIAVESLYNRARPFGWAYGLYLIAGLLFAVSAAVNRKAWVRVASGALVLALALHLLGFAARIYISGRPPVSNMYESIVWVSFGTVVFALIIYALYRNLVALAAGTLVSGFILAAADAAPAIMDPGIHTLVPVLRSNYWLTIHVLTITLGYAAFALSLGIANVSLFQFLKGALGKIDMSVMNQRVLSLNQLTYRAMQFGVVLLAAGTILGGVWADYSWGRFWGWDPKETWALIALLCYLAVLHGRYVGWVDQFRYAVLSVVCFLSVVMAWYGVNFVLGVGLHSYGFATGGTVWVIGFCGLQLLYVAAVAVLRNGPKKRLAS